MPTDPQRDGSPAQALEERIKELKCLYEKILSGFIPICASCKNIRDQEGVWHPIETYVQKRTEARFSHGICPACLAKLYPHMDHKSPAGRE